MCSDCKNTRAQCRKTKHGKPDDLPIPTEWAHSVTGDHKVLNDDDASRNEDRYALVLMDRYSRWLQAYASKTKDHKECMLQLQRFFGPQNRPEHFYSDNSGELIKALKELGWLHDTSTPSRSETNGVIERAVRIVKEGTSCTLVQSGFNSCWWAEAMMCFCFLKNVVDLLDGDETAYKRRFKRNFYGPVIPFGAQITYKPITSQDIARLSPFGSNNLDGIFVGYDQQAGGVGAVIF